MQYDDRLRPDGWDEILHHHIGLFSNLYRFRNPRHRFDQMDRATPLSVLYNHHLGRDHVWIRLRQQLEHPCRTSCTSGHSRGWLLPWMHVFLEVGGSHLGGLSF